MSFVMSMFAKDVLYLSNRRKVEGTLEGVTQEHVVIRTKDGVTSFYPKGMIKKVYRGREDITIEIVMMSASEDLEGGMISQIALGDSMAAESSENMEMNRQLSKISDRLHMIAVPLWVSLNRALS
jgi:hypothetical protein